MPYPGMSSEERARAELARPLCSRELLFTGLERVSIDPRQPHKVRSAAAKQAKAMREAFYRAVPGRAAAPFAGGLR